MSSSLVRVRKMVANHRRGPGTRYPCEVKREVMRYAAGRREQGATWSMIAEEAGLGFETVRSWGAGVSEPMGASMIPVEVVEDEADSVGIVIVSPSGFRLEGLDVVSATAVLKALR